MSFQAPLFALVLMAPFLCGWTPTSQGFVDSTTHPLRCHYELASSQADCSTVLPLFEAAWDHQIDALGWPGPVVDGTGRVSIYLTDDDTKGDAYADCVDWVDQTLGDGRSGCVAFVALDQRASAADWQLFAAHEFNHVLQYSLDFHEPAEILWEGAASALDLWQPNPQPVYIGDTADFQAHPCRSPGGTPQRARSPRGL